VVFLILSSAHSSIRPFSPRYERSTETMGEMFLRYAPCGGINRRKGDLLPLRGHRAAAPLVRTQPSIGSGPKSLRPPLPAACYLLLELR
jgi:hypothetical protein